MKLEALDHVGLAVSDLAASIEFYEGVLGLTRAHEAVWVTIRLPSRRMALASPCSR